VSDSKLENLSDLRNYLYRRAEWLWQWSLIISLAALAIAVIGLWNDAPSSVSAAGLVAILVPVAVAWLRETATDLIVRGDKCRRLILYADGLGSQIEASELAEVHAWGLGVKLDAAPFIRPYYASTLPAGPKRLADILAESAFFTEQLAARLHAALWIAFVLALGASVTALVLANLASSIGTPGLTLAAKTVAVFIGFLISGDFLVLAKKYGALREEGRHTFQRCARLRSLRVASADEVRGVADDYGVALLQCPPIPNWIYIHFRDALNDVYRASHGLKNNNAS
jgi:hypothetical protein